jgi:hypothetical protein
VTRTRTVQSPKLLLMVALLVVPPTQAAIIQYGFIDDPTWDPWPGSPLDDSEDASKLRGPSEIDGRPQGL